MRRECERRHECQLSHHQLVLNHLNVECGVEHVCIVGYALLDERLQLRVGEHLAPRQIAEACGVADGERVCVAHNVAYESLGVHLGTLVLVIYSATGHQERCRSEKNYLVQFHCFLCLEFKEFKVIKKKL